MEIDRKLTEILETVEDSPIKEPELAEMMERPGVKLSELAKFALSRGGVGIKDFKAKEVGEFVRLLMKKVLELKREDGGYKVTPATENCDLPDFEQSERLTEFLQRYLKIEEELKKAEGKDKEALEEERAHLNGEEEALIWEVSGLNKDDLTIWEQRLVREQVRFAGYDAVNTGFGRSIKNS